MIFWAEILKGLAFEMPRRASVVISTPSEVSPNWNISRRELHVARFSFYLCHDQTAVKASLLSGLKIQVCKLEGH